MITAVQRAYHQSGLTEWHRCPRRFFLERVQGLVLDHATTSFAASLGTAGHAGAALALTDPEAPRQKFLDVMLEAFEADLHRGQEQGRAYDPEQVERALERLETEYLDLVLYLAEDERVRAVEWTEVEVGFEWSDAHGRMFRGTIDAVGVAREYVDGFGVFGRDPVDLFPGDRILIDWKFARDLALSRVALSLNLQLAYYAIGANQRWPGARFRPFLGVMRELARTERPRDEHGATIPKTLEELNPAYLTAFAAGRDVSEELRAAAEKSRKRSRARTGRTFPSASNTSTRSGRRPAAAPRGPCSTRRGSPGT